MTAPGREPTIAAHKLKVRYLEVMQKNLGKQTSRLMEGMPATRHEWTAETDGHR